MPEINHIFQRKRLPWLLLNSAFGIKKMILKSPFASSQIKELLYEQVDKPPSILRCLLTLNAHYFKGTSPVCGKVSEGGFDLRNRKAPFFSLRARGKLSPVKTGTDVELIFSRPLVPDLFGSLLNRYKEDKKVILDFLNEWLKTNGSAEPPL